MNAHAAPKVENARQNGRIRPQEHNPPVVFSIAPETVGCQAKPRVFDTSVSIKIP